LKKLVTTLSIGLVIGASQQVFAQASVEKGKSVAIEIPVDSDTACNIEVTRGGEKTNVSVDPKSKRGIYEFAGRELGEETIRWEGKMKFRGLKTLGPCRGDGAIRVVTTESAETLKAQEAESLMAAQAAKLAELEAKLKAAEVEAAKTPEQREADRQAAAEAKALAEAQLAAEMKAAEEARVAAEARAQAQARVEAQARAAEQARLAEQARAAAAKQAAKDGLLANVFRSKWQATQYPCNFNGGSYKEFGNQYKWGYRNTLGGFTSETHLNSRKRITVLDEKTFEIGFTGYDNNGIVIDQLERFTMLDMNTMENVVVVQRRANLRSQLQGNLRNRLERGAGQGERSILKRCPF
jgi:chemotaxis protein histidine kinase CheA